MNKKEIGLLLKSKKEELKISSYNLRKSGLSYGQISSIENATNNYTIDSLISYLDYVGFQIKIEKKED